MFLRILCLYEKKTIVLTQLFILNEIITCFYIKKINKCQDKIGQMPHNAKLKPVWIIFKFNFSTWRQDTNSTKSNLK